MSSAWYIPVHRKSSAAFRLVCLPCAGGSATMYRHWVRHAPAWLDVIALELPAHGFRSQETAIDDLRLLVDGATAAVRGLSDLPVALFGHSFGALVAFEMCRALRREKARMPEFLAVAARKAPQLPIINVRLAEQADEDVRNFFLSSGGPSSALLRNASTFERLLPVMRADVRMAESYVYEPGAELTCPLLALGGESDPDVTVAGLQAWAACTRGAFESRFLPGGHFFIAEHEALVLRLLCNALERMRFQHKPSETGSPRVEAAEG